MPTTPIYNQGSLESSMWELSTNLGPEYWTWTYSRSDINNVQSGFLATDVNPGAAPFSTTILIQSKGTWLEAFSNKNVKINFTTGGPGNTDGKFQYVSPFITLFTESSPGSAAGPREWVAGATLPDMSSRKLLLQVNGLSKQWTSIRFPTVTEV